MKKFALLATLFLGACAQPGAPAACTAPLKPALEVDLYFGRSKPGGGEVSEAEWTAFLADTVTPRFPAGLSVVNVEGQYRGPSGNISRERSKLVVIVVFDAPAHQAGVREIIDAYSSRFNQQSVLRSEHSVCAGL
jgi:hypothetical protein